MSSSSSESGSPPPSASVPEKKRKRSSKEKEEKRSSRSSKRKASESQKEVDENLIEVDLSLPAPLSKKQKRLQKKGKLNENGEEIINNEKRKEGSNKHSDGLSEGEGEDDDKERPARDKKAAETKRSEYAIWIGNLPWSATKQTLRNFLLEHMGIEIPGENEVDNVITRVHMPPPRKTEAEKIPGRFKPTNKGFAYVDFATEQAMRDALLLTETEFSGRRVLIKPASNFEGRPVPTATTIAPAPGSGPLSLATLQGTGTFTGTAPKPIPGAKPPNKRVFIGNLGFDATKGDLEELYKVCGPIAHVHVATFEDSGKCKGYAWITFDDIESATKAVRGWAEVPSTEQADEEELDRIMGEGDEDGDDQKDGENGDEEDGSRRQKNSSKAKSKKTKKNKMRKIWANRLHGRQLRCEFAEDADTRYAKRFGKDAKKAMAKEKRKVEEIPGLPSNITGAIVAATGKRTRFAD